MLALGCSSLGVWSVTVRVEGVRVHYEKLE